uniref:Uncharacterized protein n=1 Tax=Setaria viridis TaxID=4556 RepID=A0A4U6VC43_SETVI|nr:hypothetical protein SEVIR_4G125500v2 [Setaria viridis]
MASDKNGAWNVKCKFQCPFSVACWHKIGFHWNKAACIHDRLVLARQTMQLPYFIEIFIVASWELWNLRNGKIFDGNRASIHLCTLKFKEQVVLQLHCVKDDFRPIVIQWLDSIL